MAITLPAPNKELTADFFDRYFWYKPDSGLLIWKPREVNLFPNERQMKVWNSRQAFNKAGSISRQVGGYEFVKVILAKNTFKAHRIIAVMSGLLEKYGDDLVIDHIDGNPKNNKLENLRAVSQVTNLRNRKKTNSKTGKIHGVNYHELSGKWHVSIGRGKGSKNFIGYYDDWFDAVCARKSAESELGYTNRHHQ